MNSEEARDIMKKLKQLRSDKVFMMKARFCRDHGEEFTNWAEAFCRESRIAPSAHPSVWEALVSRFYTVKTSTSPLSS